MTGFSNGLTGGDALVHASDERVLPEIARRVSLDVARFFSKERLQQDTIREERGQIGRDLHDGILQTLTGARLQLDAASHLMAKDPEAARAQIEAVRDLLAAEQRELRLLIQMLKPNGPSASASISELAAPLEALRERIERQWGLRIDLVVGGRGSISRLLGDTVFRLVQEGLANVARHAHAQSVCVSVTIQSRHVQISIADDGCGFPIRGRYDLTALAERNQGPVSLRERVASLRGTLVLTSGPSGSVVEISLPIQDRAQALFNRTTA